MTESPPAAATDSRPGLPIIGVVGAGIMGSGIAQLALGAGHEVVLHDVDDAALERAGHRIADGLGRRAAKALADADGIDAWVAERLARLRTSVVLEQLGDEAGVIVEAALESLDLKRTIFRILDGIADPTVMLASNTSALSIADIAAATARPERVLGLHFFNPAPVMRLVEVVAGPATAPSVADAAADLVGAWGRTAVRSADAPGFIVNRINRPFTLRALRLLEDGVADVAAIDAAIRDAGFPLGPFELMDLTGIDVTYAASTAIWEGLGRPDRLRPSPLQAERIAAGRLGRKTGEGFHRYADGKRLDPDPPPSGGDSAPDADAIRERILLPLVDEAWRARDEGVASADDIDIALRLGASHPIGPFERTRELGGPGAVAARLRALAAGDPSFAPSEALVRAG
ncbi:MAG TPA: 3-hydroxyacyl-CoA dehydrogenase NAD-binding domain-containing protein [Candidatus Limnocylindrales bacterium]|nr:3-hydroxyacyl-CoA dehydrogenase NAD-binding domain-containing protein [Candidatus Limnocylindrales bacterium]